jgi:hypothetical protein
MTTQTTDNPDTVSITRAIDNLSERYFRSEEYELGAIELEIIRECVRKYRARFRTLIKAHRNASRTEIELLRKLSKEYPTLSFEELQRKLKTTTGINTVIEIKRVKI